MAKKVMKSGANALFSSQNWSVSPITDGDDSLSSESMQTVRTIVND